MSNLETKFWILVKKAHTIKFDKNKIRYSKKSNREDKLKILVGIDVAIHNKELLEACCILYRKNPIIRLVVKKLVKFYMKSFDQNAYEDDLEEDIMSL
jgi:hypothetical protein